jgi:hypothetical protein
VSARPRRGVVGPRCRLQRPPKQSDAHWVAPGDGRGRGVPPQVRDLHRGADVGRGGRRCEEAGQSTSARLTTAVTTTHTTTEHQQHRTKQGCGCRSMVKEASLASGGQGVAGSNPVVPTRSLQIRGGFGDYPGPLLDLRESNGEPIGVQITRRWLAADPSAWF